MYSSSLLQEVVRDVRGSISKWYSYRDAATPSPARALLVSLKGAVFLVVYEVSCTSFW